MLISVSAHWCTEFVEVSPTKAPKLSVSGKADVEYSACMELTAFAKLIRSHRLRITIEYFFEH